MSRKFQNEALRLLISEMKANWLRCDAPVHQNVLREGWMIEFNNDIKYVKK